MYWVILISTGVVWGCVVMACLGVSGLTAATDWRWWVLAEGGYVVFALGRLAQHVRQPA